MTPPAKLWIAEAPPGVWSTGGPSVIFDMPNLTGQWSNENTLQGYRDLGYTVTGPYVLNEAAAPLPNLSGDYCECCDPDVDRCQNR